ncbi:MAG: hypothetical protein Q7S58_14035 [Candidatus Binatus sp.]|uniref:hypothetical protein n=1 Tax=Candidatus Binatus sp. TaxID=2811406 RepID=UPI00272555EE|nr:hypothetical protein [Candidatus Binatus sp.]MDO8433520.1 hypothetical protein [Candidatus Binatus sp.]
MKLTNNSGQPVQVSSLVVGISDTGLLSSIGLSAGATAPAGGSSAMAPLGFTVQPNLPGSATLTFTTPLPISAGGFGQFDFNATISISPGLSKSSTQTVTQVNATAGGSPVPVGVLPTTLGTVSTP